jgi:hypothetical protein
MNEAGCAPLNEEREESLSEAVLRRGEYENGSLSATCTAKEP